MILVAAIAVAAYALTLRHASFRADDFKWIEVVATPEGVMWDRVLGSFYSPGEVTSWYRPLYLLSWALDYAIWGTNPLGYVLTNVFLHAVSAALVALITLELGGRRGVGLLAGLLFALYPTHPFSMNYVGDRPNVLATTLYLLALFAYLRYRDGRGRCGYLFLSLGTLALALLSKEIAISLPAVALIYELYRRTPWREILVPVGALGAMVAGYLVLRYLNLGVLVGGYKNMPSDPEFILPTFGRYLGLMLAPYNPNLLGGDYTPTYVITLLVMVVLILALALRANIRNLALFMAAFLITFLPIIRLFMGWLNGFPGYGQREWNQHVYLASAFFCVGLALLVWNLDRRAIKWTVALGLLAFYAVVQPINNQPWLVASDLVHSAQQHPEQLPVSLYQGAMVFPYGRVQPEERQPYELEFTYMNYETAMSPWFRRNPQPLQQEDWRDWSRVQGTLATLDEGSGELEIETEGGLETFVFDREDLQVRLMGELAGLQELEVGKNAIVRFVEQDDDKIARSVEVYEDKKSERAKARRDARGQF